MQFLGIRAIAAIATAFVLGLGSAPRAQNAPPVGADLAAQGEWNPATTYQADDLVTSRGSAWRAKVTNTNKVPGSTAPDTSGFWELFARGFNPTGAWSASTRYQADDLITSGGQTYRAKVTSLNRQPTNTNYWEVFAAKGAPGPNTGLGAGSQSTPAISFSGDADTGIYSPAAGKIAIVEDGALFLHNLGTANTALGVEALKSVTTGQNNTAVGRLALSTNTAGIGNTAVGDGALQKNTNGANNTAMGLDALFNNTTGSANTAVGLSALNANTTGNFNAAMGSSALVSNTTGSENTAIGRSALSSNANGSTNTAVGGRTLTSNTSGNGNTAMGVLALNANTTGASNTAVGLFALETNSSGNSNTAVGATSMDSNTTGGNNTAVGVGALAINSTGSNNVAVGRNAGFNPTAPANSIFIGNVGLSGDTSLIKIGTEGTQAKAFIAGIRGKTTGVGDAVAVLIDSAGQLGTTSSSRRYKYDIETMADVSAMLAKLRPVTFRYKQAQNDGSHPLQYGLIAEEVADAIPYLAVFNDKGQPETVKYHELPSFLLAGWQAQQKTIAAQAAEIAALKKRVAATEALEARLARLEALLPQTKAAALQE